MSAPKTDGPPQLRPATLRLNLWLEQDGKISIGVGRMLLLKRIDELGSLRKASEDLKISYRAAWGKIKAAEAHIGKPLVMNAEGRGRRLRLSEYGKEMVDNFTTLFRDVEEYALTRCQELFPMQIQSFKETEAD